jgi:aspartate carbamoyltransferase regulatory subunit
MSENTHVLMIPKIELGIVIDHIPAGKGVKILEILAHYEEIKNVAISFGMNYESGKLGKKDLIKIQIEYLAPQIIQHISLVVPGVTIKAIKNFNVHNKIVIKPPREIKNLLECRNPNCISNLEKHVGSYFVVINEDTKLIKCQYCERIFDLQDLEPIID